MSLRSFSLKVTLGKILPHCKSVQRKADIFQNKKERYNINHAIFIIVALACLVGVAGLSKGSFNNYVDQILTIFDPLPPWMDKFGHF